MAVNGDSRNERASKKNRRTTRADRTETVRSTIGQMLGEDPVERYIAANLIEREAGQAMTEYQSSIEAALTDRGMSAGEARSLVRDLSVQGVKSGLDSYRALVSGLGPEHRGMLDQYVVQRQRFEDAATASYDTMRELLDRDPELLRRAARLTDRADGMRREVLDGVRRMNPTVDFISASRVTTDLTAEEDSLAGRAFDPLRRVVRLGLDPRGFDPADEAHRGVWLSLEEVLSVEEREILRERYPSPEDRAQAFADYVAGRGRETVIARGLRQVKSFFDRIGNAARLRGMTSADDLFETAMAGGLAARAQARQGMAMTVRPARRQVAGTRGIVTLRPDPSDVDRWAATLRDCSPAELRLAREATTQALATVNRRVNSLGELLQAPFRPLQFKRLTEERAELAHGLELVDAEERRRAAEIENRRQAEEKDTKAAFERPPEAIELDAAAKSGTIPEAPAGKRQVARAEKYMAAADRVDAAWSHLVRIVAPQGIRTAEERSEALRAAQRLPEFRKFMVLRQEAIRQAGRISGDDRAARVAADMENVAGKGGRLAEYGAQASTIAAEADRDRAAIVDLAARRKQRMSSRDDAPARPPAEAGEPGVSAPAGGGRQFDNLGAGAPDAMIPAAEIAADYIQARRAAGRKWGALWAEVGGPATQTEDDAREKRVAASLLPGYPDYEQAKQRRDELALVIDADRDRIEPAVIKAGISAKALAADIAVARKVVERDQVKDRVIDPRADDFSARDRALDSLKMDILGIARRINPGVEVQFADRLLMAGEAVVASGAPSAAETEVAGQYDRENHIAAIALQPERFDARAASYHELAHSLEEALTDKERAAMLRAFPSDERLSHAEKVAYAFQVWAAARDHRDIPKGLWREIEARTGHRIEVGAAGRPGQLALAFAAADRDQAAIAGDNDLDGAIDTAFNSMSAILADTAAAIRARKPGEIDRVFEAMYSGEAGERLARAGWGPRSRHAASIEAMGKLRGLDIGRAGALFIDRPASAGGETEFLTATVQPERVPRCGERFGNDHNVFEGLSGGVFGVMVAENAVIRAQTVQPLFERAQDILPHETAAGRIRFYDFVMSAKGITHDGVTIPYNSGDEVAFCPVIGLDAVNPLNTLYHEGAHNHLREGRIDSDELAAFASGGLGDRLVDRYDLRRYPEERREEEGIAYLAGEWGGGSEYSAFAEMRDETPAAAADRRARLAASLGLKPAAIQWLDGLVSGEVGRRPVDKAVRLEALRDMKVPAGNVAEAVFGPIPHLRPAEKSREGNGPLDGARPAGDFVIDDYSEIASGSLRKKFNRNLAAINTLREIESDGRQATAEEQAVIARYTGWGAMPGAFNPYGRAGEFTSDDFAALNKALTPEEFEAARRSTLNAHYTAGFAVRAMYEGLGRLGYRGGRLLEPAAGIGNFIGMMPADMRAGTQVTAVEIDSLSARMMKVLYPSTNVVESGFEKTIFPAGFFDVVMTNVPFADIPVNDRRYRDLSPSLHNYFLLRSVDQVRSGGVVMAITSAFTMDAHGQGVREALADRAELLGAIRLPDQAFRQNAGTDVVTDILVLRRRARRLSEMTPDEQVAARAAEPSWDSLAEVPVAGGPPMMVNRYFVERPEQVLGRFERTGTMYGRDAMNVTFDGDIAALEQALRARMAALPANVMEPRQIGNGIDVNESVVVAPGFVKDGGLFIGTDGQVFVSVDGLIQPANLNAQQTQVVIDALAVRDALRTVFRTQQMGATAAERDEARAALNDRYDAFVTAHGPFRGKIATRVLGIDPEHPLLCALEEDTETKGVYGKAPVFSRDTVAPLVPIDRASSVEQAIAICLNETGHVNPKRLKELMGLETTAEAIELASGRIYEDPATGGWETAEIYLAGAVKEKLKIAKVAAAADSRFLPHVAALEAVQPVDIPYVDIEVRLGAAWVPPDVIAAFAADLADVKPEYIRVGFNRITGDWSVDPGGVKWTPAATRLWGTDRMPLWDLIEKASTNAPIVVRDRLEDGTSVVNHEATESAQVKAAEIKEKFKDWVWEAPDRRERLARIYNDTFNSIVPVRYDGSHLTMPGMNPEWQMRIRPAQRNAVWRTICTGRALYGHEVGVGKTLTLVATAMELRRLGLSAKPMVTCKRANLDQIASEFRDIYPAMNLLVLPSKADAATRNRIMSQAATGNWDCILVSHDAFDRLPMRAENEAAFLGRQIDDYRNVLLEAKEQDARGNARVIKQIEKSMARLETRIEKLLDDTRRDNTVCFEDLGVDFLGVDEAHRYKNLYVATKARGLKGIPTAESKRAAHLQMVGSWLYEINGARGLVLATGTPVANTIGEVFNLQRYLIPEELGARGVQSFDGWIGTFGEVVHKVELTVTNDLKMTSRLARFVNMPELAQMNSLVFDIVRASDVDGIKRPDATFCIVSAQPTLKQRTFVAELGKRVTQLSGRAQAGDDNMLKISSDGRKAALDMRLVDPLAEDDPDSKVNQCIENMVKIWRDNPGSSQMLFLDLGLHPANYTGRVGPAGANGAEEEGDIVADDGVVGIDEDAVAHAMDGGSISAFTVRAEVKAKLVAAGIPADRILDYCEDISDAKRAEYNAMLRRGDAFGIGSTERLGTGVNAQDRLIALHHLDAPWLPAYVEQRDGRGIRHGNQFGRIFVYRYVTEGTFDAFMWQVLDTKTRFIQQFLTGSCGRELRDEDTAELSPAQVMAVATGNPLILLKVQLEEEVKGLERKAARAAREQLDAERSIAIATEQLSRLSAIRQFAEAETAEAMRLREQEEVVGLAPGGIPIVGRKEVSSDIAGRIGGIVDEVMRSNRRKAHEPIMGFGDFALTATVLPVYLGSADVRLILKYAPDHAERIGDSYKVRYNPDHPHATLQSVQRQLAKAEDAVGRVDRRIAAIEREVETSRVIADKQFGQGPDLAAKKEQLRRVMRVLSLPSPNLNDARALAEANPDMPHGVCEARSESLAEIAAVETDGKKKTELLAQAAAWQWVANQRDPAVMAQEEERNKPVLFPTPENTKRQPMAPVVIDGEFVEISTTEKEGPAAAAVSENTVASGWREHFTRWAKEDIAYAVGFTPKEAIRLSKMDWERIDGKTQNRLSAITPAMLAAADAFARDAGAVDVVRSVRRYFLQGAAGRPLDMGNRDGAGRRLSEYAETHQKRALAAYRAGEEGRPNRSEATKGADEVIPVPEINRNSVIAFVAGLDGTGTATAGDVTYRLVPYTAREGDGIAVETVENGIRATYADPMQAWTMAEARDRAIEEAFGVEAIAVAREARSPFALTMDGIATQLGFGGWSSDLTSEQIATIERIFDAQDMGPVDYAARVSALSEEIQAMRDGNVDQAAIAARLAERQDLTMRRTMARAMTGEELLASAGSGIAVAPLIRVAPERIELGWNEGGHPETTIAAEDGHGGVYARANAVIEQWAETAPTEGGYNKTDFKIVFADGEEYEGRLDLKGPGQANRDMDLSDHVREHVDIYSGRLTPPWMPERQVADMIGHLGGGREGMAIFRDRYALHDDEIGRPVGADTAVPCLTADMMRRAEQHEPVSREEAVLMVDWAIRRAVRQDNLRNLPHPLPGMAHDPRTAGNVEIRYPGILQSGWGEHARPFPIEAVDALAAHFGVPVVPSECVPEVAPPNQAQEIRGESPLKGVEGTQVSPGGDHQDNLETSEIPPKGGQVLPQPPTANETAVRLGQRAFVGYLNTGKVGTIEKIDGDYVTVRIGKRTMRLDLTAATRDGRLHPIIMTAKAVQASAGPMEPAPSRDLDPNAKAEWEKIVRTAARCNNYEEFKYRIADMTGEAFDRAIGDDPRAAFLWALAETASDLDRRLQAAKDNAQSAPDMTGEKSSMVDLIDGHIQRAREEGFRARHLRDVMVGNITPAEMNAMAAVDRAAFAISAFEEGRKSAASLADAIIARDATAVIERIGVSRDMNMGSRKAFEEITGIKIPDNVRDRKAVIDGWAGISSEMRAEMTNAKMAAVARERQGQELEWAGRAAAAGRIRSRTGDVMDGKAWVDQVIGEGFTQIKGVQSGAAMRYYLHNPESRLSYKLPGKAIGKYARMAISAREAQETLMAGAEGELVLSRGDIERQPSIDTPESSSSKMRERIEAENDQTRLDTIASRDRALAIGEQLVAAGDMRPGTILTRHMAGVSGQIIVDAVDDSDRTVLAADVDTPFDRDQMVGTPERMVETSVAPANGYASAYTIDRALNAAIDGRQAELAALEPHEMTRQEFARAVVLGRAGVPDLAEWWERVEARANEKGYFDQELPLHDAFVAAQAETEKRIEQPIDREESAGAEMSRQSGAALAGLGLTVTPSRTARGRDVWLVTGDTKPHKEALRGLGGYWYQPEKAWSFRADPTEAIKNHFGQLAANDVERPPQRETLLVRRVEIVNGAPLWMIDDVPTELSELMSDLGGRPEGINGWTFSADPAEAIAYYQPEIAAVLSGEWARERATEKLAVFDLTIGRQDAGWVLAGATPPLAEILSGLGGEPLGESRWLFAEDPGLALCDRLGLGEEAADDRGVDSIDGEYQPNDGFSGRTGIDRDIAETLTRIEKLDLRTANDVRRLFERMKGLESRLSALEAGRHERGSGFTAESGSYSVGDEQKKNIGLRVVYDADVISTRTGTTPVRAGTPPATPSRKTAMADKLYLPGIDKEVAQQRRAAIEAGDKSWEGTKWDRGAKKWFIDAGHENAAAMVAMYGPEKTPERTIQTDGTERTEGRDYISVPVSLKDEAKAAAREAGGRINFDRNAASWYVPEGSPPAVLKAVEKYRTPEMNARAAKETAELQTRREAQGQEQPRQERGKEAAQATSEKGPTVFRLEGIDKSNKDQVKAEFPGIAWNTEAKAWEAPANHPKLAEVVGKYGTSAAKEALGLATAARRETAPSKEGSMISLPGLDVRGMSDDEKKGIKAEFGLSWSKSDKVWQMPADHPKAQDALKRFAGMTSREAADVTAEAAMREVASHAQAQARADRFELQPNPQKAGAYFVVDNTMLDGKGRPGLVGFAEPVQGKAGTVRVTAFDTAVGGKEGVGKGTLAAVNRKEFAKDGLGAALSAGIEAKPVAKEVGKETPDSLSSRPAPAEQVKGHPQKFKGTYSKDAQDKIHAEIAGSSNEQLLANIAATKKALTAAKKDATAENAQALTAGLNLLTTEAKSRGLETEKAKGKGAERDRGKSAGGVEM